MPRFASAVAALLLSVAAATAGGAKATEQVYVLSQDGAVLSQIDSESGNPVGEAIKLDKVPAGLALAPDGAFAYVTHSDLSQVSVVDLAARRVVRTIPVPGSPFGIAAASGGRLYVGDWNDDHVTVVDAGGTAEVPQKAVRVQVGRAPGHIVLTPDESLLFVANREGNSVSAIRTADLEVAATIQVGRAPFALALSPDAERLYVGNVQSGTVSVIDTAKLSVAETWTSGAMPYGTVVTPDGARLLVTHQGSGTVAILDGSGKNAATIRVGDYPEGIAIGADGTRAYVANWFSSDVSVIDLESLKEIHRIKSPSGPRAVASTRRATPKKD